MDQTEAFKFINVACGQLSSILIPDLPRIGVDEDEFCAVTRRLEEASPGRVMRDSGHGLQTMEPQFRDDLLWFAEVLKKLEIQTFEYFWVVAACSVFAEVADALGASARAHDVVRKVRLFTVNGPSGTSFDMYMSSFKGSLQQNGCRELLARIERISKLGKGVG